MSEKELLHNTIQQESNDANVTNIQQSFSNDTSSFQNIPTSQESSSSQNLITENPNGANHSSNSKDSASSDRAKISGSQEAIGTFESFAMNVVGAQSLLSYPEELPTRAPQLCAGCPHRGSFYAVKNALGRLKIRRDDAIFCGDIGCYTLGNAMPLDAVDTCLCMGAGITMAQGFAITNHSRKCIAFVGDSTFFASGLTGMANAIYNNHDITLCVLDNSTTAMTGSQPHPGTGKTLMGRSNMPMDTVAILDAMGVEVIEICDPLDRTQAEAACVKAIAIDRPSAVVFKSPCIWLEPFATPAYVDEDICTGCKKCITEIGCPAIRFDTEARGDKSGTRGQAVIDRSQCAGCELCVQICPFEAIEILTDEALDLRQELNNAIVGDANIADHEDESSNNDSETIGTDVPDPEAIAEPSVSTNPRSLRGQFGRNNPKAKVQNEGQNFQQTQNPRSFNPANNRASYPQATIQGTMQQSGQQPIQAHMRSPIQASPQGSMNIQNAMRSPMNQAMQANPAESQMQRMQTGPIRTQNTDRMPAVGDQATGQIIPVSKDIVISSENSGHNDDMPIAETQRANSIDGESVATDVILPAETDSSIETRSDLQDSEPANTANKSDIHPQPLNTKSKQSKRKPPISQRNASNASGARPASERVDVAQPTKAKSRGYSTNIELSDDEPLGLFDGSVFLELDEE